MVSPEIVGPAPTTNVKDRPRFRLEANWEDGFRLRSDDDQFHVLHLSGHGSQGGIELEDEDGSPLQVTAAELVERIRNAGRPLPLVFLSSCHGGSGSGTGLAAALVAGGVGSVIAMQAAVTDGYATLLAGLVYKELARPGATAAGPLTSDPCP